MLTLLSPDGTNPSGWCELLGGRGSSPPPAQQPQTGSASNLGLKGCTDKPQNFSRTTEAAGTSDTRDAVFPKLPAHDTIPLQLPTRGQERCPPSPAGAALTVARSFCVRPLLCRPCWITLPTSRETLSWCSSSVSRSSLAVFFVMKCCLFWPAAPVIRSKNKKTTKDKQNKAQSCAKKYQRIFPSPQLPRIPGSCQDFSMPTSALISPRSCPSGNIILALFMVLCTSGHAEPFPFPTSHLNFTPDGAGLAFPWGFNAQTLLQTHVCAAAQRGQYLNLNCACSGMRQHE